ncbi:DUF3800 domain-containing protein [Burkholderia sp. Ax-1719]|uniref:DUF3800 domain-containing protein n=1 Tax=Burkholderia sp. Ax-1719 TaxID=2608334 RepID=UPI001423A281|nr:DUF3800 domain-containing protein [Burkholderia sp. Ax-1719]NIE68393.1 DUF3800 domain-containing protein [Burkholderia sp. Ax-1719]
MYLAYLDDSGSPDDPNSQFFVLGGIMLFERQTHWLESRINPIAARFEVDGKYRELHAGPMRAAKDGWDKFSPAERAQAAADVLRLLENKQSKVSVVAAVVEKSMMKPAEILPYCYELLAKCFDDWLAYRYQKYGEPARGIFILDRSKSAVEQNVQTLHRVFKHTGHGSGKLRNFAEVPMFLDSKASRLIQMADNVAYWIYRRYQSLDNRGFEIIEPHFFKTGAGRTSLHELVTHATRERLKDLPAPKHPFPAPRMAAAQTQTAARHDSFLQLSEIA